jgi:Mg/Co/Ni transporter MgtE
MISAGVGFALRRGSVIPREFGTAALVVAVLFVVAGIAAVFGPAGLALAIIMSIVEAVWILAAAIALARVAWR